MQLSAAAPETVVGKQKIVSMATFTSQKENCSRNKSSGQLTTQKALLSSYSKS